jgi:hypothetical protein
MMEKKSMKQMAVLACSLFLTGAIGFAQAGLGKGRLAGSVRDEAGNPIAAAAVQLEFKDAGRRDETRTDAKGEWVFIGVGTGNARVTVRAEGFQTVVVQIVVSQLQRNKPLLVVLQPVGTRPPVDASPPQVENPGQGEVVTRTYALNYVTPTFVRDSLRIYMINHSYGEGSNLISVALEKKNVVTFEEQLRKLDIERKSIQLRIFSVLASKEGKSDTIENKDLKRVLGEVSNLLNFKSYLLDGASVITVKDGSEFNRLMLSSSMSEKLRFDFKGISVLTGSNGKRSVKFEFWLYQLSNKQELLSSETEIPEDGYLVAGVSRIGDDGKSLVLVINAEIK